MNFSRETGGFAQAACERYVYASHITAESEAWLEDSTLGHFEVIETVPGKQAYRLGLSPNMKTYPGFHVSLLELAATDPHPRYIALPAQAVIVDDEEECNSKRS